MIKSNELRIGNWVIDPGDGRMKTTNIYQIGKHQIDDEKTNYLPIPLTAEILEKAGFEYDGATTLSRDDSPLYFKILAGKGSAFVEKLHQPFEVHCEYVHQLQNLYFALTGEELTVNFKDLTYQ